MRLGVTVPAIGSVPDGGALIDVGSAAEVAGADGLWVVDHGLRPAPAPAPPLSGTAAPRPGPVYDVLTCCAYLAAATLACRVGPACLVLPQRELLPLARAAASLDRMSAGRLVLGVGAGWDQREMEALGYDYSSREARLEEMVQALRECWSGRPTPRGGEHVRVPAGLVLEPVPVASPAGPPLVLVGRSQDALLRAASLGDGWLSVVDVDDVDDVALAADVATVRTVHRDGGRPGRFEVVVKLNHVHGRDQKLLDAARRAQDAGADEVVVDVAWERLDAAAARLQALSDALRS